LTFSLRSFPIKDKTADPHNKSNLRVYLTATIDTLIERSHKVIAVIMLG